MKGFAIDWGPAMVTKQAQTNTEPKGSYLPKDNVTVNKGMSKVQVVCV